MRAAGVLAAALALGACGTELTGHGPGITGTPPPPVTPGVTAPSIVTTQLPPATLGLPYRADLAGSGGTTPYSWTVPAGTLPAGLTLERTTGILSGTPAEAGTFLLSVTLATSVAAATTILTLIVQ